MDLERLLSWATRFATEEGPTLARSGGKLGIANVIAKTAEKLMILLQATSYVPVRTYKQRMQTYRRVLGYSAVEPMPSAKPNTQFHPLFTQFINNVAEFWRDKRISDVIRERAFDPSFGSIATVRRAGLDLRNNLKWSSYGHVNVFRIEVLQLLDEAFKILGADDVKKLFGADNAWDVVEEVMLRYFKEEVNASQRHRLAVSGRAIIRWLAHKYILNTSRAEFEALLREIADDVEEWLTSAEVLGIAFRGHTQRVVPFEPRRNGGRKLRSAQPG